MTKQKEVAPFNATSCYLEIFNYVLSHFFHINCISRLLSLKDTDCYTVPGFLLKHITDTLTFSHDS